MPDTEGNTTEVYEVTSDTNIMLSDLQMVRLGDVKQVLHAP